jgi:hypothetical protein
MTFELILSIVALVVSLLAVVVALGFYPFIITNGTIIDDIRETWKDRQERKQHHQ